MARGSGVTDFRNVALAAFPRSRRQDAACAASILAPLVNVAYLTQRHTTIRLSIGGETIAVPRRIAFLDGAAIGLPAADPPPEAQCLMTRSTDGHMRQRALASILELRSGWAVPFVVLLSGDYVVEIMVDILRTLPELDRAAYADFVRENRPAMGRLRCQAVSAWNEHYRTAYPDRGTYPGLLLIRHCEQWAS